MRTEWGTWLSLDDAQDLEALLDQVERLEAELAEQSCIHSVVQRSCVACVAGENDRLLAEVERLEAELETNTHTDATSCERTIQTLVSERDRLEAENATLRTAAEAIRTVDHRVSGFEGEPDWCLECDRDWPCPHERLRIALGGES